MADKSIQSQKKTATVADTKPLSLRTMSVNAVCLSLCLNVSDVDPVDYLILACLILQLIPVARSFAWVSRYPAIQFAILAFFLSYAVSAFVGGFSTSFVINFILNVILFLVLVSHCATPSRLSRTIHYLFLGFGLSVLIASFQAFDLLPVFTSQFEIVRDFRFMGLYGDPNLLGAFAVFFCIYWLNAMVSQGRQSLLIPSMSTVYFSVSFLTLVFTQSRSAWGGFVIAVLVYFGVFMKGLRRAQAWRFALLMSYVIGIILVIVHQSGALELIESRIATASEINSEEEEERFGLFYTLRALDVAAVNPLGVGPGNAVSAMNLKGGGIGAHNAFVQVALENGWVAGLTFMYLVVCLLLSALKKCKRCVSPMSGSASVMFSALLSLTFCGLFQDLIQWKVAWVVPALFCAAIVHKSRFVFGTGREGFSASADRIDSRKSA